MTRLWGGRFTEPPSVTLERLNESYSFDRELLAADIAGSVAWAEELALASVLERGEARRIVAALRRIGKEAAPINGPWEDVHSYVEARLFELVGKLAGKLHTGRSRNDQVATDLLLYLRGCFHDARGGALKLAKSLATRGAAEATTPMPGYTHGRRAEPITFGHWCLAHAEMLLRDAGRLADAAGRADACPLGAGALAGTPLPIDRARLARSLGFRRPAANSLDAVSDRDGACEYLFASTLLLCHLSRLAEDLLHFTSDECAFAALPDRLCTGSSRMPHKKNPDLLELTRGHAGRAIGELAGLLAVVKGLPLAYDKDLQLDKEPVFRMRNVLADLLELLSVTVDSLTLDRAAMRHAAAGERALATELADALAERGVPFRAAHEIAGRRFVAALDAGVSMAALPADDEVGAADLAALDLDRSLSRRATEGGTAPARVKSAARRTLARIAKESKS